MKYLSYLLVLGGIFCSAFGSGSNQSLDWESFLKEKQLVVKQAKKSVKAIQLASQIIIDSVEVATDIDAQENQKFGEISDAIEQAATQALTSISQIDKFINESIQSIEQVEDDAEVMAIVGDQVDDVLAMVQSTIANLEQMISSNSSSFISEEAKSIIKKAEKSLAIAQNCVELANLVGVNCNCQCLLL